MAKKKQEKLDEILRISENELRQKVEKRRAMQEEFRFKFGMTPRALYGNLQKYVIGQEDAMQKVCNAVCYHYQSLSKHGTNRKCNVLLIGPTGCGKTRFMEHMAWRLKRPLITVSCHDDLTASDLVGRYLITSGETVWVDGHLAKSVRSGAICYLD